MIVGGMSKSRLAAALASLQSRDLRIDQNKPVPEEIQAIASGEFDSREELDVLRKLAGRDDAELRYRILTRHDKRRLCRWGLCPRLANAHGLCREHWRKGHAMLARARRERQGLAVAA